MMQNITYLNYKELDEFYTISQICNLFDMSKEELKAKCKQHGVEPRRNEIGEYGFVKYDVRKLHNAPYHETRSNERNSSKEDDPWA